MFDHVVHCDWSKNPGGRWTASASRDAGGGWRASGPQPVPALPAFVADLLGRAKAGPVLAAFDFPIGLPAGFGRETGLADFREVLDALANDGWPEFFDVAATSAEVSPRRPFYPKRPGGTSLRHLLDGHGVATIDDVTRYCERAGPQGGAAGCMFWTLGAKQVGKAMLHGWSAVVIPARAQGARIWPFDGELPDLATDLTLVLAESYPGDAYGQLGLSFKGRSKRRTADRQALAPHLLAWGPAHGVTFDEALTAAVRDGFPPGAGRDDGFDAVVGLLAALAVVDGRRPASPPLTEAMRRWEGWILGKA